MTPRVQTKKAHRRLGKAITKRVAELPERKRAELKKLPETPDEDECPTCHVPLTEAGYRLTMLSDCNEGVVAQEIFLLREEFIALKRQLAHLRGYAPSEGSETQIAA